MNSSEEDNDMITSEVEPSKIRSTVTATTAARRGSLFGARFTTSVNRKRSMGDGLLLPGNASSAVFGEILGFAVAITLPYSRTGPKPNGMRVLYVVAVTMLPPPNAAGFTPCKSWEAVKGFRDFSDFDREVRDVLSNVHCEHEIPALPSRTLLTSQFDEKIIAERRLQFLQYLQALLQLSEMHDKLQPALAKFLNVSVGNSSRALLDSPTAANALAQVESTAFKEGETQHGFVYRLTGQYGGIIKPTYRLVWMLLNTGDGELKIYNSEQTSVLAEMSIGGEYGKVTACEPRDFGIPATNAYGFSVWTPHRELILYTESQEDRTMWINTFQSLFSTRLPNNAVAAPKPKARPPPVPRPSAIFIREAHTPILLHPSNNPRVSAKQQHVHHEEL